MCLVSTLLLLRLCIHLVGRCALGLMKIIGVLFLPVHPWFTSTLASCWLLSLSSLRSSITFSEDTFLKPESRSHTLFLAPHNTPGIPRSNLTNLHSAVLLIYPDTTLQLLQHKERPSSSILRNKHCLGQVTMFKNCLLYTSPSPRDLH